VEAMREDDGRIDYAYNHSSLLAHWYFISGLHVDRRNER